MHSGITVTAFKGWCWLFFFFNISVNSVKNLFSSEITNRISTNTILKWRIMLLSGLVLSSVWCKYGSTAWELSVLAWLPGLTLDLPCPSGLPQWLWHWDRPCSVPLSQTHTSISVSLFLLSQLPPPPALLSPSATHLPFWQPTIAAPSPNLGAEREVSLLAYKVDGRNI